MERWRREDIWTKLLKSWIMWCSFTKSWRPKTKAYHLKTFNFNTKIIFLKIQINLSIHSHRNNVRSESTDFKRWYRLKIYVMYKVFLNKTCVVSYDRKLKVSEIVSVRQEEPWSHPHRRQIPAMVRSSVKITIFLHGFWVEKDPTKSSKLTSSLCREETLAPGIRLSPDSWWNESWYDWPLKYLLTF